MADTPRAGNRAPSSAPSAHPLLHAAAERADRVSTPVELLRDDADSPSAERAKLAASVPAAAALFAELAEMAEGIEASMSAILNGADALWPAAEALARQLRWLSAQACEAFGGDPAAFTLPELVLSPVALGALRDAKAANAATVAVESADAIGGAA